MTPRALAWAWLGALPARPFTLLETAGSGSGKRLSLAAGEPLFVFEGRGASARLECGGRSWALGMPPERALREVGAALKGRGQAGFWPLLLALGYEAGGRFERLPRPRGPRPMGLPDWWGFLPGLWAVQGARGRGGARWDVRAGALDAATARRLAAALGLPRAALDPARRAPVPAHALIRDLARARFPEPDPGPAPRPCLPDFAASRAAFERSVRRVRAHIRAGDVYQVNLSHRFEARGSGDAFGLFQRLMRVNPSPMAAFVDLGRVQVVSASPERLFSLRGGEVETCPIAGTAPRRGAPGEREALKASLKDRAEHVMLVDLERNDLGRVCAAGSVRVVRLGEVRSLSHVHHLVSRIRGRLRPGLDLPDLLQAGFPGGSITGAPKVRCMEIIAELEGRRRGWYTGTLGWWDPKARRADLNILIRTLFVRGGRAIGDVGAGIVVDSRPAAEWRETLAKAEALLRALGARG